MAHSEMRLSGYSLSFIVMIMIMMMMMTMRWCAEEDVPL